MTPNQNLPRVAFRHLRLCFGFSPHIEILWPSLICGDLSYLGSIEHFPHPWLCIIPIINDYCSYPWSHLDAHSTLYHGCRENSTWSWRFAESSTKISKNIWTACTYSASLYYFIRRPCTHLKVTPLHVLPPPFQEPSSMAVPAEQQIEDFLHLDAQWRHGRTEMNPPIFQFPGKIGDRRIY